MNQPQYYNVKVMTFIHLFVIPGWALFTSFTLTISSVFFEIPLAKFSRMNIKKGII